MTDAVVVHPKDSINLQSHAWYFAQCEQYRELLSKIQVIVPVRPADGINVKLAQYLAVWYGEGTPWCTLNDHMGGFIEVCRANMSYQFLHDFPQAEWLLMIDNDMEPPINLPYLLARHGEPIVAACAMSVSEKFGPQLCFTIKDTEGEYRFPARRSCRRIPAEGLVEVGHVGTGAMLVHRSVLESFEWDCADNIPFYVPADIREKGAKTGTLLQGEDITFCNQVRARGYRMFVDMEAHCGHRKTMSIQWDDAEKDKSLKASDWILPADGLQFNSR